MEKKRKKKIFHAPSTTSMTGIDLSDHVRCQASKKKKGIHLSRKKRGVSYD